MHTNNSSQKRDPATMLPTQNQRMHLKEHHKQISRRIKTPIRKRKNKRSKIREAT